jgi:hypothetical protein
MAIHPVGDVVVYSFVVRFKNRSEPGFTPVTKRIYHNPVIRNKRPDRGRKEGVGYRMDQREEQCIS